MLQRMGIRSVSILVSECVRGRGIISHGEYYEVDYLWIGNVMRDWCVGRGQ